METLSFIQGLLMVHRRLSECASQALAAWVSTKRHQPQDFTFLVYITRLA